MRDNVYQGGPVMIRIDGSKIRQIREQKGLTQLYVATAVDVTTDTVSRWENKRYPSIKKENGQKLAEALEVELEAILETDENHQTTRLETGQEKASFQQETTLLSEQSNNGKNVFSSPGKILLFFLGITLVFLSFYIFRLYFKNDPVTERITVTRTVPPHFIAGQPLPVFLHLSNRSEKAFSLILRENLPPGSEVTSALPEASNKNRKDHSIQWLKKLKGPAVFVYSLKSDNNFAGSLHFSGLLKVGSNNEQHLDIIGDNTSTATFFHWADSNQDNRISDEEILVVYDLVDTNEATGIDMDLLEEIWLGEGYIWHPDTQRFSILD